MIAGGSGAWPARVLALCALALVLAGCAVREQRPTGAWMEERERLFAEHSVWSVSGRVSLSDGTRGGQLAFEWQADGDEHLVLLRTVMGGRQWRLRFDPNSAFLEGSEVGQLWGTEPDSLVEAAVGWPIPVSDLAWWIRGLIPPDGRGDVYFAADGTLDRATTAPWILEFQRFAQTEFALMPSRLQADSPPYRVRVVLRNWNLSAASVTKSL